MPPLLRRLLAVICAPVLPPAAAVLMRGTGRAVLVNLAITILAVASYVALAAGAGVILWMLAMAHAVLLALLPRPGGLSGVAP